MEGGGNEMMKGKRQQRYRRRLERKVEEIGPEMRSEWGEEEENGTEGRNDEDKQER